jgi:hypothetical protein
VGNEKGISGRADMFDFIAIIRPEDFVIFDQIT